MIEKWLSEKLGYRVFVEQAPRRCGVHINSRLTYMPLGWSEKHLRRLNATDQGQVKVVVISRAAGMISGASSKYRASYPDADFALW